MHDANKRLRSTNKKMKVSTRKGRGEGGKNVVKIKKIKEIKRLLN